VALEPYVAKDDKEVKHECAYVGSHEDSKLEIVERRPVAPSAEFARMVALSVLGGSRGKYRTKAHCGKQMTDRTFDVFDMEYVIRNGKCIGSGEYCEGYKNYKYTFHGNIDGIGFDAVFALSAEHDLIKSPLMVLITGCWKTKTGRRGRIF
jgi:hypothetical protein